MLRRSLLVLGPILAATGALFACESDSASGAAGALDGGDVAVVTPPGTTNDAAPDDGTIASGAVSVSVTGTLLGAVNVIFHDASGNVLDEAQTSADGKASSVKSGIAMVTALQAHDTLRHAVTWTNVSPGDRLTLHEMPDNEYTATYAVTAGLTGNRAGLTAYAGGCTGTVPNGQTGTILLNYRCVGPTPTAFLASGVLAGTGALEYAFTKAGPAAPPSGGTAAVTIPNTWAAPASTQLTVTNNNDATSFNATVRSIANGLVFDSNAVTSPIATQSVNFDYPAGFGDALLAQIAVTSGGNARLIAKRFDLGPAVTIDRTQLLGALTSTALDASNPARPVLSWGGDSTAATDGGLVSFEFTVPGDDTNAYSWTFVVPPGATTVTAPALPSDAAFAPAADGGAASFGRPAVQFIEADVFDSPASFRQQQGAVLGAFSGAVLQGVPVLAANGQFRMTAFVTR